MMVKYSARECTFNLYSKGTSKFQKVYSLFSRMPLNISLRFFLDLFLRVNLFHPFLGPNLGLAEQPCVEKYHVIKYLEHINCNLTLACKRTGM